MGINNLNKFIKSKFPNCQTPVHLSKYRYKIIAIDTSNYMYRYKCAYGDRWLSAFVSLVMCLRSNDIHCVFVYDTKAPVEKTRERAKRKKQRDDLASNISSLENALRKFQNTGIADECLVSIMNKTKQPRLLGDNNTNIIHIELIEEEIEKKKKQNVSIISQDFDLTRELFEIMKVPYLNAEAEAETLCSQLCLLGYVDGVLSEDTDVLAYGSKIFLNKINTYEHTCIEVDYETLLQDMEFTSEQFLDFCIMCGTDYNDNIPNIGAVKAYNLLKHYDRLDDIEHIVCNTENEKLSRELECCRKGIDILNFHHIRKMFRPSLDNIEKISYCAKPDFQKLHVFLAENNCTSINTSKLENAFKPRFEIV